MDPEQTFIRVQERLSQMVTPRVRAALEYFYLFTAVTLFCILVVMHTTYVQQVCFCLSISIDSSSKFCFELGIISTLGIEGLGLNHRCERNKGRFPFILGRR